MSPGWVQRQLGADGNLVRVAAARCILKEAPEIVHQRVVITDDVRIHQDPVEGAKYNFNFLQNANQQPVRLAKRAQSQRLETGGPFKKEVGSRLDKGSSFGSFVFTYVFHVDL